MVNLYLPGIFSSFCLITSNNFCYVCCCSSVWQTTILWTIKKMFSGYIYTIYKYNVYKGCPRKKSVMKVRVECRNICYEIHSTLTFFHDQLFPGTPCTNVYCIMYTYSINLLHFVDEAVLLQQGWQPCQDRQDQCSPPTLPPSSQFCCTKGFLQHSVVKVIWGQFLI